MKSTAQIDGEIGARPNPEVNAAPGVPVPLESLDTVENLVTLAARLRAAMRQPMTAVRVASALGEAFARWRDRSFAARRETVAAIAASWGWSEPLLDESIDALLAPFSSVALEDFARRAPRANSLVGVIMPGNIPGAGIHEIALGLIAECALIAKTATAEPIFLARFAQTLREADPEVGARIAVLNWDRERNDLTAALRTNCGWIAAFGSDQTIGELSSIAQPSSNARPTLSEMSTGAIAAAFGNRISGALVAAEMATGKAATAVAESLARDVSLFEQQGCLSPHHIFVESRDGSAAREFIRSLAAALDRCSAQLPPPRRYGLEEAAAVRRVRESARWRAIGGDPVSMLEGAGLGWTMIYDENAHFTPSPGYRTITVSPIDDLEDLRRRLQTVAGRIEAFAIAAPASRRERLCSPLRDLGICYLCEPGAMQSPPLDWGHGGGVFLRALGSSR
jgi:hypothetical protein